MKPTTSFPSFDPKCQFVIIIQIFGKQKLKKGNRDKEKTKKPGQTNGQSKLWSRSLK